MGRLFIEKVRGFYRDRINEAGAYSEFNPFRKKLEEGENLIEKYKDSSSVLSQDEEERITDILEKLKEIPDRSKGSSKDQSKNLFKNLLRQTWFRKRVKKVTTKLKKLNSVNKIISEQTAHQSTKSEDTKKEKIATEDTNSLIEISFFKNNNVIDDYTDTDKNENETIDIVLNVPSDAVKEETIAIEELFSEILEILERRLGPDHEELVLIASEIKGSIDRWYVSDAE
jgi:hypothetical protein